MQEIERLIIKRIFPSITKKTLTQVLALLHDKSVPIVDRNLETNIRNIAGSIIRHRYTEYNNLLRQTDKKNARFYCQPIIDHIFDEMSVKKDNGDVIFIKRTPRVKKVLDTEKSPTVPNLVGKTYGEFTVVRRMNSRWVVRCSCGTEENRKTQKLLNLSPEHDRCVECLKERAQKK